MPAETAVRQQPGHTWRRRLIDEWMQLSSAALHMQCFNAAQGQAGRHMMGYRLTSTAGRCCQAA